MKKGHLIVGLLGVVLFIWVIAHMGRPSLARELKAMRIALPIVLLMSLCRLFLQTAAWALALEDQGISVQPGTLVGTRLASQGMGYLTVLGPVLSETMKIKILQTAAEPTIMATFLDNGVYWFTSMLLAVLGWFCIPFVAVLGLHIGGVVLIVLGLTGVLYFIAGRKAMLPLVVRKLGNRAPRWLTRAGILESSLRDYRRQRPALVGRMFCIAIACQLLMAAEVVAVLWSLHLPIHFFAVLTIEGIIRVLKLVSGWIPARLGSDEGGAISAFAMTGFSPMLGLALAFTRRLRDLLWALIGLAWLVWKSQNLTESQTAVVRASGTFLGEAA